MSPKPVAASICRSLIFKRSVNKIHHAIMSLYSWYTVDEIKSPKKRPKHKIKYPDDRIIHGLVILKYFQNWHNFYNHICTSSFLSYPKACLLTSQERCLPMHHRLVIATTPWVEMDTCQPLDGHFDFRYSVYSAEVCHDLASATTWYSGESLT